MCLILERYRRFLLTRPLRDVTHVGARSFSGYLFLLTRPLRDVTVSRNY